ncbi:MAG: hypothetical protein JSV03_04050 [Planctomycetota bacterium]|nr:MAG: hypothetical protein JSV03_04050 [Planctomycetota bacterium]
MTTDDLRTYDETNRVLMTVPEAFSRRPEAVLSWVWRKEVEVGKSIDGGVEVADIQWDNNVREVITAPGACCGKIKALNRDIVFENLPFAPPQILFAIV